MRADPPGARNLAFAEKRVVYPGLGAQARTVLQDPHQGTRRGLHRPNRHLGPVAEALVRQAVHDPAAARILAHRERPRTAETARKRHQAVSGARTLGAGAAEVTRERVARFVSFRGRWDLDKRPVSAGNFGSTPKATRFRSRSATASTASAGPEVPLGCRQVQNGSGGSRRSLQRLLADLGRGGPEGARPPFLSRMRLNGLLHRTGRTRADRHLDRLVRRSVLPAAHRIGVRLAATSVGGASRLDAPELWWDEARPLYEAGKYAEAAEKGRELLEARPDQAYLFYNVACAESLAGQTAEAIEHLRRSIEMWDGCRNMARGDPDFDPVRGEPAFEELMA